MSEREKSYRESVKGGPLSLPIDDYNHYSAIGFQAIGTTKYLHESWKRPKRHNKRLERQALSFTIALEERCAMTLAPSGSSLLLLPADTTTQYEFQAAVRTVHAIIPFTRSERDVLLSKQSGNGVLEHPDGTVVEPELVDRWHEWLWMDRDGVPQNSTETLGASAILGESAARLSTSLVQILGWDQQHS
ncbi:MAG TPA: hypothetical protein VIJ39_04380 [Solirubrobacteraceae bacterium]